MARQIPEVSSLVRCVITNFFRRGAKSSARSTNAAYGIGPIRSADRVVGSRPPPSGTDVGWAGRRTRIDIPGRASQRVAAEEGEDDPAD